MKMSPETQQEHTATDTAQGSKAPEHTGDKGTREQGTPRIEGSRSMPVIKHDLSEAASAMAQFDLAECTVQPAREDTVWYIHHEGTGHVDYIWFCADDDEIMFIHPENIRIWEMLCEQLEPLMGCQMYVSALFRLFVDAMSAGTIKTVQGLTCPEDAHWQGDICSAQVGETLNDYFENGRWNALSMLCELPSIIAWERKHEERTKNRLAQKAQHDVCTRESHAEEEEGAARRASEEAMRSDDD